MVWKNVHYEFQNYKDDEMSSVNVETLNRAQKFPGQIVNMKVGYRKQNFPFKCHKMKLISYQKRIL